MKPLVVNLLGGPGTGKSSVRAGVFHDLKFKGIDCEEALEYAKDLTWKKSQFTLKNQIKVFGEQHDRLFRLLEQIEVIITDSPLLLTPIYDNRKSNLLTELAMEEYNSMWNYTIFLTRHKPYNPNGRNQTEEEAKQIDNKILNFLINRKIEFETIVGNSTCKEYIVNKVLTLLGKS
jgi:glutathione peroxidase-family protein